MARSPKPFHSSAGALVGEQDYAPRHDPTWEDLDLPAEVSLVRAAAILGVDKKTVIKYIMAGWLEYRDVSAPGSSKPVYRLKLDSVLAMRTAYRTVPASASSPASPKRVARASGATRASAVKPRHIALSGGWN